MKRNEILNGVDENGAKIGMGALDIADSKPIGYYDAVAVGPVECLRKPYVKLRDHLTGRKPQGWKDRFAGFLLSLIPIVPKWKDHFANVVTTVGKNDMLDKYFFGSAYTAAWYIGLIGLTSYVSVPVIGDTAGAHATWVEDQTYSQATRPSAVWSTAASGGSKALASAAVFSINGAGTTIKGCFQTTLSTKGGTTGILYSAGLFTGGDKVLANGDTLNVSYTATLT